MKGMTKYSGVARTMMPIVGTVAEQRPRVRGAVKRLLLYAATNDLVWAGYEASLQKVVRYLETQRRRLRTAIIDCATETVFQDLTVKNGPFKGMRYPEAIATGGALFPRLLGSYEAELHEILATLCQQPYTEILDIGSAEGYYAVGLAMRIPSARVFAYDSDGHAQYLCRRMAELNHVEERVVIAPFCDPEILGSFPFTDRALIISDCEGYEKTLFSDAVIKHLARHDVLIEIHEAVDINMASIMRSRFEKTHAISIIRSVDDRLKALTYSYGELDRYDVKTRRMLLAEHRSVTMEWFFMSPLEKQH
jgi:precorrin-6B methylase 2